MKTALLLFALLLSISLFASPSSDKAPKSKMALAASYPGGDAALNGFKSVILNKIIHTAVSKGITSGTYNVQIRFDVDAQGNVSNVQPVSAIGFGLEQEAMAQFGKSGRWIPARNDGRSVKASQTQSFRFEVL